MGDEIKELMHTHGIGEPQARRALAAATRLDALQLQRADVRAAICSRPTEAAMEAALRVADAYRDQIADLERQVENLKLSNAALRLAGERHARSALAVALIDHITSAEYSSLVLCHATYNENARRWTFAPLSSIEEAQRVMDADIAAADAEPECACCAGTGEGLHEGASCAACGGRGF